jgi:hypothetical protein
MKKSINKNAEVGLKQVSKVILVALTIVLVFSIVIVPLYEKVKPTIEALFEWIMPKQSDSLLEHVDPKLYNNMYDFLYVSSNDLHDPVISVSQFYSHFIDLDSIDWIEYGGSPKYFPQSRSIASGCWIFSVSRNFYQAQEPVYSNIPYVPSIDGSILKEKNYPDYNTIEADCFKGVGKYKYKCDLLALKLIREFMNPIKKQNLYVKDEFFSGNVICAAPRYEEYNWFVCNDKTNGVELTTSITFDVKKDYLCECLPISGGITSCNWILIP